MLLRRKGRKDAKTRDDKERAQFLSNCPNHKDGGLFIVGVNSKDNVTAITIIIEFLVDFF